MEETTIPSVFEELETEQIQYATQGERFVNFLIDMVVAYAFDWVLGGIIGATLMIVSGTEAVNAFVADKLLTAVISVVGHFIIYTLIEGVTKGRTLGKLVTRTQAVRAEDFSPISWKDAALRSLSRMVPFEPFSALGNAPWHDTWTRTTVIKKVQRFV